MEREVRYCTTEDGVRIAYCVEGEGPPLLMTPLVAESFVLEDVSPPYRRFSRRLAESCTLIQFDPRSSGSSQRGVAECDPDAVARDIEAVVGASGFARVALLGRMLMSPAAIAFAARHPDRVDRLALFAPTSSVGEVASEEESRGLAHMARANWETASRVVADMSSRREFGDAAIHNAEWYRRSGSGEDYALLIEGQIGADVTPLLGSIRCPTLILQPMDDGRYPVELGQRVASAIDGASFVTLPGGGHQFALGDAEAFLDALLRFLGANRASAPRPFAAPVAAGAFREGGGRGDTCLGQRAEPERR